MRWWNEAVRHVSRLGREHVIGTDCEELLLARMDARLIIQVLVNLTKMQLNIHSRVLRYRSVPIDRGIKSVSECQIMEGASGMP